MQKISKKIYFPLFAPKGGNILNYFHYIIGVIAGSVFYLLGGYDHSLRILIYFVVIDYSTGLLSAIALKNLDSRIGRKGIAKKIGLFLSIIIAHLIDQILGSEGMVRMMSLWFYISKEGLSSVENLAQMGVPIPELLKRALKQVE